MEKFKMLVEELFIYVGKSYIFGEQKLSQRQNSCSLGAPQDTDL